MFFSISSIAGRTRRPLDVAKKKQSPRNPPSFTSPSRQLRRNNLNNVHTMHDIFVFLFIYLFIPIFAYFYWQGLKNMFRSDLEKERRRKESEKKWKKMNKKTKETETETKM